MGQAKVEAFVDERRKAMPSSTPQTLERSTSLPEQTTPVKKKGAFRALQHRNFRIFWSGQMVSLIGTWMQNLAQGWLIVLLVDPVAVALLHHGVSASAAGAQGQHSPAVEAAANFYSGWINFAGGLPIFILTLFAGVLADRVSKRHLLLVTQSVLIACAISLGLLCEFGLVQIWHVMLIAVIAGIAAAFDMPTRQSFVVEMVSREDLPSAIALNSSVFNAARAVGPAVAGLLLAANISIGAAFIGNGILSFSAIAALLLIRLPARAKLIEEAEKNEVKVPAWQTISVNMREGFAYVRAHPVVRNLVLLVGAFGTFAFSFNVLIPVFVRYTLLPHATDATQVKAFGVMETVRGIGALCGALTVALFSSPRRQRNMLITGSLLATSVLLVFGLSRTIWLADLAMAVVSFAFVLCFATSNTLMQLNVPDHLRGRVMSIYMLMFIGTGPFGSLFAGWVAKYIGAPTTILLCAIISLIAALFVVFRPGGLRDMKVNSAVKPQPATT